MLRDQLKNLAVGLNGAASGMSTVIDGIVKGFPGPLLNSTLAVIERQVRDAGTKTAGCQHMMCAGTCSNGVPCNPR
jgi:hypothetical protein